MDNISSAIPLTLDMIAEIDKWILKFPSGHKKSAVIAALTIVQQHNNGWLSEELLSAVAQYLELPLISVYEVATFYSNFELQPVGKYKIGICTNISCMLCGCKEITKHLKNKLNINFGEITKDGRFSLKAVECIASCDKAPVIDINGNQFANVTIESIDQILMSLE
jgi:NADH-quinone oxidoreductase subunit E